MDCKKYLCDSKIHDEKEFRMALRTMMAQLRVHRVKLVVMQEQELHAFNHHLNLIKHKLFVCFIINQTKIFILIFYPTQYSHSQTTHCEHLQRKFRHLLLRCSQMCYHY